MQCWYFFDFYLYLIKTKDNAQNILHEEMYLLTWTQVQSQKYIKEKNLQK